MNKIIKKIKENLQNGPVTLKIKVVANAKQNSIETYEGEILKVKINKPAVDNKANKAIIEYFSEMLNLSKSCITILRGEKNSIKDLRIVPKNHII